jgi:hypothetical protein
MRSWTRLRSWTVLAVVMAAAFGGAGVAEDSGNGAARAGALDAAALARRIDQAIARQLQAEKIQPSPRASDAEFLRRVYLDITGAIPPADKVQAFLNDKAPNKRARVIDELLASPKYGKHLADIWEAMLFPRGSDNRRFSSKPLWDWLEKSFNENKHWDKIITELLTATGSTDSNGAAIFFVANPTPDKLTDATSKLFLGVQLQCAQCHNHPFTQWKQTEYWGMAAFFSKVRLTANAKGAAKKGQPPEVSESGKGKSARLPESVKVVPAKFFKGEEPTLNSSEPYRPVLARWLTAPDNPYFARAMVNRMWHHFFGRGFVQPVDDMHEGNVPTHPELLKQLAEQFAAHDFDLKFLVRAICTSETYQRTSRPHGGNDKDVALFSHMPVKSLSPEQLFDSLTVALGAPDRAREVGGGKGAQKAKKGPGDNQRANFVSFFQTDDGPNPTEYQSGIPQALRLMNSPQFNGNNAAIVNQLTRAQTPPGQVVERLCLATLSRRPTPAEMQKWTAFLHNTKETRKAVSDLLWALLNSSEFALNH